MDLYNVFGSVGVFLAQGGCFCLFVFCFCLFALAENTKSFFCVRNAKNETLSQKAFAWESLLLLLVVVFIYIFSMRILTYSNVEERCDDHGWNL